MYYRLATILAREVVSADLTKVIDLNLADPVSQFQIVYESTGAGGGSADHHAARCITKIELVDGSDVLFSLSGQEAQAVDWYHNLVEPANQNIYLNANNAEMVYNMNFGRFLYDPLFAFDPRKFINPQLKITIDRNAGGVQSVAGFLQVLAKIFDEKAVTPEGFLMHKEINNYGLASAAHEYVDLPTDYPFRKMFIAAQTEGTGPEYLLDTLKLSEDNDRKIPFEVTAFQLLRTIVGSGKPFRENVIVAGSPATNYFYCTPCYWPKVSATTWSTSNLPKTIACSGGDGGKGKNVMEGAGYNINVGIEGYAPHGAMEIPFGLQNEPADWYDVTKLGSLRLDILSILDRTSADTVQIFLQQLRRY